MTAESRFIQELLDMSDLASILPMGFRALLTHARRYEILQPDGSRYITRWVLWGKPSLGDTDFEPPTATSCFIHEIHAADPDRHLHDHPWAWAESFIVRGGYKETRLDYGVSSTPYQMSYQAGHRSHFDSSVWHGIQEVEPGTVTLFLAGPRIRDWGFLVDGHKIGHREYLAAREENRFTHMGP